MKKKNNTLTSAIAKGLGGVGFTFLTRLPSAFRPKMGFGKSFELWGKKTMGCDLFPRVGACGRRPSESADPGGPASWVLLKKRYKVK